MNIAEILKDCPSGIKLYSPLFGEVEYLRCLSDIIITKDSDDTEQRFFSDGKYWIYKDSECILFPSKDNRDWSTFKVPQKFKRGDFVFTKGANIAIVYGCEENNNIYNSKCILFLKEGFLGLSTTTFGINRPATKEEKQQLLKILDKKGYVWDTKKLEVIKKEHAFKPFEKVLVRDDLDSIWVPSLFSRTITGSHPFICIGGSCWKRCIPYEGNQELLGTCDEPKCK